MYIFFNAQLAADVRRCDLFCCEPDFNFGLWSDVSKFTGRPVI